MSRRPTSRRGKPMKLMRFPLWGVLLLAGCRGTDVGICEVREPEGRIVQVSPDEIDDAPRWDIWRYGGRGGWMKGWR